MSDFYLAQSFEFEGAKAWPQPPGNNERLSAVAQTLHAPIMGPVDLLTEAEHHTAARYIDRSTLDHVREQLASNSKLLSCGWAEIPTPLGPYDELSDEFGYGKGPQGAYHQAINDRNKEALLLSLATSADDIAIHHERLLAAQTKAEKAYDQLSPIEQQRAKRQEAADGQTQTPAQGTSGRAIQAQAFVLAQSRLQVAAIVDFGNYKDPHAHGGVDGVPYWTSEPGGRIGTFQQGPVNDCYFLAAIATIASTPEGNAAMASLVKKNADGNFEVTFPGCPDETFIVTPQQLRDAAEYATGDPTVDVLQLAGDQWSKKHLGQSLFDPGHPTNALSLLTGMSATESFTEHEPTTPADQKHFADMIRKAAAAGHPLIATVSLTGPNGEAVYHSITINSYDPKTDTITFTNPWDSSKEERMTLTDFTRGVYTLGKPGVTGELVGVTELDPNKPADLGALNNPNAESRGEEFFVNNHTGPHKLSTIDNFAQY